MEQLITSPTTLAALGGLFLLMLALLRMRRICSPTATDQPSAS